MKTYHFTLVLGGVSERTQGLEDSLFESNCDDALVCFKNNVVFLEFDREAENFESSVKSAIACVENAGIGASVIKVEPDEIVSANDIAKRTNLSRQNISQFIKGQRGKGNFPTPIHKITENSPLWRWSEVVKWLLDEGKIQNKEELEIAKCIEDINAQIGNVSTPQILIG